MNNNRKRTALCLLGAALCVFMAFGAALALGRYPITPAALLAGDAMAVRTFTVLRLPRAVMALVGGFGLAWHLQKAASPAWLCGVLVIAAGVYGASLALFSFAPPDLPIFTPPV